MKHDMKLKLESENKRLKNKTRRVDKVTNEGLG